MNYQFEEIDKIELVDYDNEYVYDIEVDDNSHTFIANDILVHNSVYTTYGTLFDAMTKESQEKFNTPEKRVQFILKFNKEFLDKQNTTWCENIYNPRHGKSIHEFELETISIAQINLAKKHYLKALVYSKGKFFEKPKLSATGIELVQSSSPGFCRDNLPKILNELMFNFNPQHPEQFIYGFLQQIREFRKQFYTSDIEYISQSVKIGEYKKYVIDDKNMLILAKRCPPGVHSIARYNFLAHKHGQDNLRITSGKIKYYNILGNGKDSGGFFGFPAGELPTWAPPMDKYTQWDKCVISPLNRFLQVLNIPLLQASEEQQLSLF